MSQSPAETPPPLPRKKPSIWRYLIGVIVLLLAAFFYQLFGPSPAIVVSKETTYITEPLRPDGLPDYEKYVLERMREGVTPENNAALVLLQVIAHEYTTQQEFALVAEEIGLSRELRNAAKIAPLHGAGNRARIAAWRREIAEADSAQNAANETELTESDGTSAATRLLPPYTTDDDIAFQIIGEASERPWTTAQIPPLAAWIAENNAELDLIVAACNRPRFYAPAPSLLNDQTDPFALAISLTSIQLAREAARVLSARAMWHLGEGRIDEAWQDVRAIHRLGCLLGNGATLIEQLVGVAIQGIAHELLITFIDHGNPTVEQAIQVQKELDAFEGFAVLAKSSFIERLYGIDGLIQSSADGAGAVFISGALSGVGVESERKYYRDALNLVSIDWNIVLQDWNTWYDRVAAAAAIEHRVARELAFVQIESELAEVDDRLERRSEWIGGTFNRSSRSRLVSLAIAKQFFESIMHARVIQDQANAELELLRLAAALAVFRAKHGQYPDRLEQLVPDVVPTLPVDLFNGKPFYYQRDGAGFLLHGAGENGIDDGGSSSRKLKLNGHTLSDYDRVKADAMMQQIPPGADDISIRVPRPAFAIPDLPPGE